MLIYNNPIFRVTYISVKYKAFLWPGSVSSVCHCAYLLLHIMTPAFTLLFLQLCFKSIEENTPSASSISLLFRISLSREHEFPSSVISFQIEIPLAI